MAAVRVRDTVRFILGDETVVIDAIDPTTTLLDWLRLNRRMTGTKEGCAEGDCGACTVLVGRLEGAGLVYRPVNACIRFVSTLDGCHVLTVEHVKNPDGTLHPVQRAMVAHHASQCGFCTPGIVMSLYALWLGDGALDADAIERALQGNLCRCTGYEPIVKAGLAMGETGDRSGDRWFRSRDSISDRLRDLNDGARIDMSGGDGRFLQPATQDDLADLYAAHPEATPVAGATDVGLWVTKAMRRLDPLIYVGAIPGFCDIHENKDTIRLGGGATYADAWPVLARYFPQISELVHRIGGEQVRAMGTIGGNIANGSPIGDMPPPLIALDARLYLRHGNDTRTLALEDFFLSYGKQDRAPGEFVAAVEIPIPGPHMRFAVYKVSKRFEEDISTLCGAFMITLDGDVVTDARLAFGGMAGTPMRARGAEAVMIGAAWNANTARAAGEALAGDFTPLTDWRGTSQYRLRAARGLLQRFFLEENGTGVPVRIARERRLSHA